MTLRFMSRQDIADHLGVTLATVKGYANFPEPDVIVGRNQGWAQATIDAWTAARDERRAERVNAAASSAADASAVPG